MDVNWELSEKQLKHLGDKSRYLLIEGSAGSGKTIFAAHQTVHYALTHPGARMLVCRQTMPSLKETSWHEIREVLLKSNIDYYENRTEGRIEIPNPKSDLNPNGKPTVLLFRSLDDEQKIRSLSVDYIYVEQAEETDKYSFFELRERLRGDISKKTYGQFLMVITPDTVTHWIYELFHEKGVKNSKILHFHYTENPFIDDVKKREYEELKELNEDLYRKYTEGKWGRLSNLVYDGNWDTFTESISQLGGAEFYTAGVDFGFNNPSAFLLIAWRDKEPYIIDEVYQSGLTNRELIEEVELMLARHSLKPHDIVKVFGDGAEPDRMIEFRQAGFDMIPGIKDVEAKLNAVKTTPIHIHGGCEHTLFEIKSYVYRTDSHGHIMEDPVKFNDHAMDALGYCVYGTVGIRSPMIDDDTNTQKVFTY